jgi:MarR family 2-MHQ and catechol resistance regulon transcriptional repressor
LKDIHHTDAVLRAFILFVQTAYAILKYTDAHLYRKAHLSVIKLIVLQALVRNNGVMIPSEIADWTQTERHNITALVSRMKRDGLVRTERDRKDKRTVNVTITAKGQEVITQAMPVAREIVNKVMSSIGESDAVQLEKLLRVLIQNAQKSIEQFAKYPRPRPG